MTRRWMQAAFGAALVVLASSSASAQMLEAAFDPEQFSYSPDPRAVGLLESATPLSHFSYATNLALHMGGAPLELCITQSGVSGCSPNGDIVGDRLTADLSVAFGLLDRFDVRLSVPFVLYQGRDFSSPNGGLSSAGVGDLQAGVKVWILKTGGLTLGADAMVTIPWSGGSSFIGTDGTIVRPRALVEWRRDRLAAVGHLGYRFRQTSGRLGDLYVNDEFIWAVGAEYQLQPDKIMVGASVFGAVGFLSDDEPMSGDGGIGFEEAPIEFLLSGRYWHNRNLAIELGGGAGLTSGYGSPDYRFLAGVRWFNDLAAAPAPAPLPPAEPTPADSDNDGILDGQDACPTQPETVNSIDDEDGCPEDDTDGDGLLGSKDQCPSDPEDKDAFQDEDGCPDADNDADGVADASDKCPMEAETVNQFEDADGCPDEVPTEIAKFQGKIEGITFALGKATIRRQSFKVLDEAAAILNKYPDIKLEVQGHTDNIGSDEKNRQLSQDRAQAVVDYLVGKGVAADRLQAVGYGPDQPVADNATKVGRESNRRVEFVRR